MKSREEKRKIVIEPLQKGATDREIAIRGTYVTKRYSENS